MNLESPKVTVDKSANDLCEFLSEVKNFEQLMPENTSKFEVLNEKRFLFALKGMPEIVLELKDVQAPNKVILGAASDKLPFTLTADINEIEANKSEAQLEFAGEFNAMMAMMIKGPITNFIGALSENMAKL
ncbi:SRPBCC family protein [Spongiivirga citrea]|uniref:SRPBCC family protein n=1 Tax=Spongiivirga citrea TaxID=1481457 RepID=A0A6M0CN86_9FLAO|nr:SRPBCC family protein [Spongiivirga citrea]NER18403.1 SRPBCC family protein [Spongiivirga citrea]